jgi:small subunit ribosomal protein S16
MGEQTKFKLDLARVDYWLGVGAQPSDTVRDLIRKARELQAATDASSAS